MRSQQVCTVLIFAVLFAVSGIAQAADTDPVTVTGILQAAGSPLTEAQQKTIAGIQPGGNMRELMTTVNGMFDEKQTAALKAKLGTTPARGNQPETVRNLTQVLILEIARVPLTEKQLAEINALPAAQPGQGGQGRSGGEGQGSGAGRAGQPEGQGTPAQAGQGMAGAMAGGINAVYTDAQREAMTKYMGATGGRQGGAGGQGGQRGGTGQ